LFIRSFKKIRNTLFAKLLLLRPVIFCIAHRIAWLQCGLIMCQ